MKRYGVGVTKASDVVRISRSLYRNVSCRRDSGALFMRIHKIAHTRVHYGYRLAHEMLRPEGYRRQSQAGLSLGSRARACR